jgi:NADH-quinone oxidoreductase subunit N
MPEHQGGMELWAVIPELTLAGFVLLLLVLAPLLPARRKDLNTWLALLGLAGAGGVSAWMLSWEAQPVFLGTYAVDPFAVYFKLFTIAATGLVLLATHSYFRGRLHEGAVPPLLLLTGAGAIGLAASQDLALIALFILLVAVGSYTLVGIAKDDRRATEGAIKLFLFSAPAGGVMLYGMTLLYGLTGTLGLPELASALPAAPLVATVAALGLVLAGYGFKITLVPFHFWAPDTYQGTPTPIAGYLAVVPKAAGLAVLLRTLAVAFGNGTVDWPIFVAVLAAATMTLGNIFALRQTSAKRLLAYSSIAQAGYILVGVAAAGRDPLAVPGMLLYLVVYLFMNLGAFLAIDAIERRIGSDDIGGFSGLGRRLPVPALALALSLLSLAGIPPLGGFVGKAMLFGAALGAGWAWLGVVMGVNVAISLFYYLRVLEPMYLRSASSGSLTAEPAFLRMALVILAAGALATGVLPQPWVGLASQASEILATGLPN